MLKNFKRILSLILILSMVLSVGGITVFAKEEEAKTDALEAEIAALYDSGPGLVGRTHKMQAFIMELALHAKSRNPDFKIIPQDGINLAFVDGDSSKGVQKSLLALVDGWGIEGMVGNGASLDPNQTQQKYITLVQEGIYVSDTTVCNTQEQLDNYYRRAAAWGMIPYPRIGGELAQTLFEGKRWAVNGDYFWVDHPNTIGLGDRVDGKRDVNKLTDAKNYLYNINGRPYDAWGTWDAEEAAFEKGDGDRTRITDSYGCGLLVPSKGGAYQPIPTEDGDEELIASLIEQYGSEWDWWWRDAGLDETSGRETWLNALRNSDYDVIYIDSFYNHRARPENQTPLTKAEIESLKQKPDGGRRQVIAYLSVGSAEQNRWYCQDDWVWVDPDNPNSTVSMKAGKAVRNADRTYTYTPYLPPEGESAAPTWLATGYGGNYPEEAVVQWWHPEWRDIIIRGGGKYAHKTTGDNTSSIDRIINQGFDGVYLDNVGVYSRSQWDAFESYWAQHGGIPGEVTSAQLVDQKLDYTENPVDIPNPDRGFYRANDGMVVPVTGSGSGTMNVGQNPTTVGGATVETRISHVYFDLRNFSDNAFVERGERYNNKYQAPENVSIKSRGDEAPWDYDTHFDYWLENVVPTWKHGTSQPLTEDALAYIRDKLDQVRAGEGVTMVRFSYDGPGYSWVDCDHPQDGYIDTLIQDVEPDKETILTHIRQIAPILHEYEDVIMGVDGGFFGPWGEMHSTAFGTSPEAYAWLLDALLDAVPESRSITVQGGAFLSWYNARYGTHYTFANIDQIPAPQLGTPEARFGFFNDSYAYGEDEGDNYPNDWGSLSEGAGWPGDPLGDADSYDRGRVMTWIRKQNNFYGGEAQGDETRWNTYPFVAWEASYAQTVYLNADYSREVHNRWGKFIYTEENVRQEMTNLYEAPYDITDKAIFDPVYEGKTGAEYWRDRLGYRLVLRKANASGWVAQDGILKFDGQIQNVGFGNIVNQKQVSVILKSRTSGKTYAVATDIDARQWRPDLDSRAININAYRDLSFSVNMDDFGAVLPVGEYDIYLKINDPKEKSENKRCIRFANNGENIWEEALGANLIGSTLVLGAEPGSGEPDEPKPPIEPQPPIEPRPDFPIVILPAAVIPAIVVQPESPFVDVPAGAYYADAVQWAVENGITTGTSATTFGPGESCTRAQMVTFLWRAAGQPRPKNTTCAFTDVVRGSYYEKAVLWAAEEGVVKGTSKTTFSPEAAVTRAQAVTMLWQMAGEPKVAGWNRFADVASGAYYEKAVLWATENGVTNGTSATTFSPANICTRAQIVTLLYRYLS